MRCCNCTEVIVPRFRYQVNTMDGKIDGQPLKADDYLELGYMAGRFGINPFGKPNEITTMKKTDEGVIMDINSCASYFFEKKLKQDGIRFDRIA